MSYSVTCQCGKTHPVTATQAGSALLCDCSRSINVPLLSHLRRAAGQTPIPLSTVETIEARVARGELPSGEICARSGRRADRTIWFHVQCERAFTRGGKMDSYSFVTTYLLFGLFDALLASKKARPEKEFGRETSLNLPVRIAAEWESEVLEIKKQSELKAILEHTPIYAQLLEEFPEAFVTVKEVA